MNESIPHQNICVKTCHIASSGVREGPGFSTFGMPFSKKNYGSY